MKSEWKYLFDVCHGILTTEAGHAQRYALFPADLDVQSGRFTDAIVGIFSCFVDARAEVIFGIHLCKRKPNDFRFNLILMDKPHHLN